MFIYSLIMSQIKSNVNSNYSIVFKFLNNIVNDNWSAKKSLGKY